MRIGAFDLDQFSPQRHLGNSQGGHCAKGIGHSYGQFRRFCVHISPPPSAHGFSPSSLQLLRAFRNHPVAVCKVMVGNAPSAVLSVLARSYWRLYFFMIAHFSLDDWPLVWFIKLLRMFFRVLFSVSLWFSQPIVLAGMQTLLWAQNDSCRRRALKPKSSS